MRAGILLQQQLASLTCEGEQAQRKQAWTEISAGSVINSIRPDLWRECVQVHRFWGLTGRVILKYLTASKAGAWTLLVRR